MDRRVILYVGDRNRAEQLGERVAERDWHVMPATEWQQALGMYVTFWPDTVVLDVKPDEDAAEYVYFHLQSMDVGPMVLIGDSAELARWETGIASDMCVLSRRTTNDEIINAIENLFVEDLCAKQTA